jgi:uncharacterized YigZ family protein
MEMSDRFQTVASSVRVKSTVGACRFHASVARTDSEEDARAFIERVSEEFADATHNAYAYKIGLGDRAVCRQSDADEPAGTAGNPMLQAIEKAGVTNVTVVGTRYFGGVKLGIGGLVRAYRSCAEAGLEQAGRSIHICFQPVSVKVSYDMVGPVLREVTASGGEIEAVDYSDYEILVRCLVPLSIIETLREKLLDLTRGKVGIIIGNTKE